MYSVVGIKIELSTGALSRDVCNRSRKDGALIEAGKGHFRQRELHF